MIIETMWYAQRQNDAYDKIAPMAVGRLRDIHIDHTPLISQTLSDEVANLNALP